MRTSSEAVQRSRLRSLADSRARRRLADRHRAEYERLVNEERAKVGLPPLDVLQYRPERVRRSETEGL